LKENIVQGVAAFLNSQEGGALLLGVASDGTVVGLADDYQAANPQRPGRDRYELNLRDLIGNHLGREHADAYAISFQVLGGRDVGRRVTPAAKPVYLNGDFSLRDGNRKSKLKVKEAAAYIKARWG
jgi:Putative DNA-binding domain